MDMKEKRYKGVIMFSVVVIKHEKKFYDYDVTKQVEKVVIVVGQKTDGIHEDMRNHKLFLHRTKAKEYLTERFKLLQNESKE